MSANSAPFNGGNSSVDTPLEDSTVAGSRAVSVTASGPAAHDADVEKGPQSANTPGAKWKDKEVHEVPYNNLWIVMPALFLSMFLASLDQTIVAVALPSIIRDIGGGSGYSWAGTAYLIMAASLSPLYGKLAVIIGRKPVFFFSISIFMLGSALCGAAQNFTWFAICRGVQGIGSGGMSQMTMVSIADIVPLHDRPKYSGLGAAVYGIASVLGPLVGGLFSDHVSWRWCFWINLPTGGVAIALIFFFLHFTPTPRQPMRQIIAKLDFVGLFFLIGGAALLLVGFQEAETNVAGYKAAKTLAPLVVGITMIVTAVGYGFITSRDPVLPPRLFQTRTTGALLGITFFSSLSFFTSTYYVPLYFQILGSSATMAGVRQLPLSVGGAIFAIVSGVAIRKMGKYRPSLWLGSAVMTIGFGLMIMLSDTSTTAEQEIFILIAGIGVGVILQTPTVALQAAMPLKDMPTTIAAFLLVRTLGATVGIAIGDTIFTSQVRSRLATIPGVNTTGILNANGGTVTNDYDSLSQIQPPGLRRAVQHAFAKSMSVVWIVCTAMCFANFCLTLIVREYSMKRTIVRGPKNPDAGGKTEEPATSETKPTSEEMDARHG